ncbi:uncharacterized protein LOC124649861 isoform X2 [Lolium rigidum]|uniref:uncharacterized protein LOC124649861 isoform X2 n=1 Tax=Lolium rigidum TaxID=89674 RepID=UPI001F5C6853|nr:uncharacterized protein LOC124649861 isoform X2 [Lolium rigidum]
MRSATLPLQSMSGPASLLALLSKASRSWWACTLLVCYSGHCKTWLADWPRLQGKKTVWDESSLVAVVAFSSSAWFSLGAYEEIA